MANMVDNGLTILEKYEKIADEFAIGFADWIRVCKLKGRPYNFENIKELFAVSPTKSNSSQDAKDIAVLISNSRSETK